MQNSLGQVFVQIAVFFGSFLGGGLLGSHLATTVAPGSWVAATLSTLMFPAALAIGFTVWLGLAILSLPVTLYRLATEKDPKSETDHDPPPPGSVAFLVVCVILGSIVGLVSGMIPGGWGPLRAVLLYGAVSTAYGAVLWRLARSGLLPFLED